MTLCIFNWGLQGYTLCVLSVLFIYLFFFLIRDCIMGAGLNIESLLWVEESKITLFFYQNWYFYNRINCCTSIRCVLTY